MTNDGVHDWLHPSVRPFDPTRDNNGRVVEAAVDYVQRMQRSVLPEWPESVLREWLYRHNGHVEKYVFLGFERFAFTLENWPLMRIPGREAFADETFCDNFSDVHLRAETNRHDWLAHYMIGQGTWNTPIVLLDNAAGEHRWPSGASMKQPVHLLEGHRRLSFLNGLARKGLAKERHDVWVVTLSKAV